MKLNGNRTEISSIAAIAALCLSFGSVGCGSEDTAVASSGSDQTATVEVALTTVPTSTQCIRITATPTSGSATTKTFTVTAGSASTSLQIGPLGPGNYTFAGDAFNSACTSISGAGNWLADPVPVTLRAGVGASITLTFRKNSPVTVAANFVNNVKAIAAGYLSTIVLTDSGLVQSGQINNSKGFVRANFSAFDASSVPGNAVISLDSTAYGACALRADGTVWCWGNSLLGELGPGIAIGSTSATPVQVTGISNVTALAGGTYHVCAHGTSSAGTGVHCWGLNSSGQLGNNSTTDSQTPVFAYSILSVESMSLGYGTTYVVNYSGNLIAWGSNNYGQLGDGTTNNRLTPATVVGESPVKSVAAGNIHVCTLRVDGTVRCWGANLHGQLGIGNTASSSTPVQITGLLAQQVVAGHDHTCTITTAGQTWCWGKNDHGQMGDGTNADVWSVDAPALGTVSITKLSSNSFAESTCGLSSNLDLYCWGRNLYGGLGDGTNFDAFYPVKPVLQ